jgi:hypothetical protein
VKPVAAILLLLLLSAVVVRAAETAPYPPSPVIKDITFDWSTHLRAAAPAAPAAPAVAQAVFRAPYPASTRITGVTFDDRTVRTTAPGSDIWPVTWAEDDNLYTAWGDGGGFGGTDADGRVSLGVARVGGGKDRPHAANVAGGKDAPCPAPFTGKSEGILALGNTLYLWRDGDGSDLACFKFAELWRSDDLGATWRATGVRFSKEGGDFPGGDAGFFAPAFCQFGRGYAGARDNYVYIYAPDVVDPAHWEVRRPGRINLLRVPRERIESKDAYEYYAGEDAKGAIAWTQHAIQRRPVWTDADNGTHRIAVSYNPGVKRYLLTTVAIDRAGRMSIYDAPEPWGPWTHVHTEANSERWGSRTILFSFVNKWLGPDGRDFVLVHTKDDRWATIEGHFQVAKE